MPTSGTGISSEPGAGGCSGFSLLELLVVLVIIGIFFGAAMLAPGIVGNDRAVEQEAQRLKSVIDLVREEALMQSRDFGVLFNVDGYRFYAYDHAQLAWVEPPGDELLAPRRLAEDLGLELFVEDREVVLEPVDARDTVETPEPQVMILSSGEVTPFEAVVRRDVDDAAFRLVAELTGSTEVEDDASDLD